MKNLNFLFILFTVLSSCELRTKSLTNDFFDPDIEISVKDLKSDGFHFVNDWSMYNKVQNDTAFMYQCFYDQDPVFIRTIHIDNWATRDSIEIAAWIESKGGLIASPIYHSSDNIEFFVQGKKSGLYSKCATFGDHFFIKFFYPDTHRFKRSEYRVELLGDFITQFEYEGTTIRFEKDGILNINWIGRDINMK